VVLASAGTYASLQLAERCQHPTTQFFTGRMLFLPPNQQRQSTEGKYMTRNEVNITLGINSKENVDNMNNMNK